MPSLIDIRRRIRSVKNTQQITRAMKMVSAAKLRRAQERVLAARPYAGLLRQMLGNVAAAVGGDERVALHPLLAQRSGQRIVLVHVTGDRGLAGAFHGNLNKGGMQFFEERPSASIEVEAIGRKGRDFFRKRGITLSGEHLGMTGKVVYADAAALADRLATRFQNEEIDAVYLLFNEFRSAVSQKLTVVRVLPVEMPRERTPVDYLFEQPPQQMLNDLLPRYLRTELYRALLESAAAEHAARMTAMEAATSNAADMIERLTLYMNRVRQASITKEIIEVVSGAAASE
jgi:F-type H+-transporting ATPase subunit gamma